MLVAVEEYSGKVAFYDLRQRKLLAETNVGFRPHELTIDKESPRAFVANFGLDDLAGGDGIPGNTISVIDLKTLRCRKVPMTSAAYVSNTQDRYISINDIEHMKVVGTLPAPAAPMG